MFRSDSARQGGPMKLKSPRRCINDCPNSPPKGIEKDLEKFMKKSPVKNLSDSLLDKPIWIPTDMKQLSGVKEALHVSTYQSLVACREDEQKKILVFCKQCVEQEKAGSLYVCGLPGTGKSLSVEKIKGSFVDWAKEVLPFTVFQPQALEFCARKVASASGDMRKVLEICRSAIEVVEAELRESTCGMNLAPLERGFSYQQTTTPCEGLRKQENNILSAYCSCYAHKS